MKSDHRILAVLGLLLMLGGGMLLLSRWIMPALSSSISGIGAFPLVIGLVLLGVAEEQWRHARSEASRTPDADRTPVEPAVGDDGGAGAL